MNETDQIDQIDHSEHGLGTPDDGPYDSDCVCRATEHEAECAKAGCGFCSSAISMARDKAELEGKTCSKTECGKPSAHIVWGSLKYYPCEDHYPEIKALVDRE